MAGFPDRESPAEVEQFVDVRRFVVRIGDRDADVDDFLRGEAAQRSSAQTVDEDALQFFVELIGHPLIESGSVRLRTILAVTTTKPVAGIDVALARDV